MQAQGRHWIRTGWFALVALCATVAASAQSVVGFQTSSLSLQAGERRLVPVYVSGIPANGLGAFQWIVRYDPQVVRVFNPNEAARGTVPVFAPLGANPICASLRGGTCTDPQWMMISTSRQAVAGPDVIDNVEGKVRVVYGTTGTQQPPNGTGVIALLEIEAAAPGSTNLTFEAVILSDRAQPPQKLTSTTQPLAINVSTVGSNRAPVIATVGAQTVAEGGTKTIAVHATDDDGNAITLSATGLPSFATFTDDGGGNGRLIVTPGYTNAGTFSVSVVARDNGSPSLSDAERIDVTVTNVNRAPTINSIPPGAGAEAASLALAASANDLDGDTLTYSATGLPPGVTINSATGAISGTPTYSASGSYAVNVTVSDGTTSASTSFTLVIANTNRAPLITTPPSKLDDEGQVVTQAIQASDPDGDTLTYGASGLPGSLSVNPSTGIISGTLNYTSQGTHTVTISASDGTATATTTFAWGVTNVNLAPTLASPGNQNSNEGANISLQLSATDPDPQPLTFSATNLPPGLSISPSGLISGEVSYDSGTSYSFTVTVSDGSLSDSATLTWTINPTNRAPVFTPPDPQFDTEANNVSVQMSATDPDGNTVTYSASGLPPNLTINSTTGRITGQLTYTSAGTYTVTVTATDGTTPGSVSFTWTVQNRNRAPTLTPHPTQTSEVGQSVNVQIAASDPDGDPLSFFAYSLPDGLSINETSGLITGTVTAEADSTYYTEVGVEDEDGASASILIEWRIFAPGGTPSLLDVRVSASADDAEETASTGSVNLTNDDLELGSDNGSAQYVGIRFRSITIPRNATILNAYIQFQVDETNFEETAVEITGQLAENPVAFTATAQNISSRPITNAGVEWLVDEWDTIGMAGQLQRTPNLADIVREIIALPNWRSNNSMVMIISGSGERTAEAWNGMPSGAGPLLHVDYLPPANQSPAVVTPAPQSSGENASVSLTVSATDPESQALTCSATGLPPGLIMGTTTCTVTGNVTWGSIGTYNPVVTVTDGITPTSVTFQWTVTSRPNTAPTVFAPGDQATMEGGTVSVSILATDAENDSRTYSATGLPAGLSITTAGLISGTVAAASAGNYSVTVSATDGQLTGTASFTWKILATSGTPRVVEARVIAGTDDAEERVTGGTVTTGDNDLELITDGTNAQRVGLRFRNLNIPKNATITKAWLQFTVDKTSTGATSLTIRSQAADNAAAFTTATNNINSRTLTTPSVAWNTLPSWSVALASGADQRSPDIASLITPVVTRASWAANNAIVFVISGSGSRTAKSFESTVPGAAILHVEYTP